MKHRHKMLLAYWKCEIMFCKVRVHNATHVEYHYSSYASKPDIRKTLADLKQQAVASQKSFCSSIVTASEKFDKNEMAHMASSSCVSCNMKNWRQTKLSVPPVFQRWFGYEIHDEYKCLDIGGVFLQFGSGKANVDRLLLFATDKGLDECKMVDRWWTF